MNQMPKRDDMRTAVEQPRAEALVLNSDEKHDGILRGTVITLERAMTVVLEDVKGNMSQGFSSPLPGRIMDCERALEHARRSALRNMERSRDRSAKAAASAQYPRPGGEGNDRRASGPAVRYGG